MSLEKATQIMYEEFGFKPEKTKIIYYNLDKWEEVKKRTGNSFFEPFGIFELHTLKAHVPKNALLSTQIHEYLGHGSFFEYSKLGEKIILNDKILRKLHFKLFNVRLGGYILKNYGIDNKVWDLSNKKRENKSFQKNLSIYRDQSAKVIKMLDKEEAKYEGFAVWLEKYLIKKIGSNGKKQLTKPICPDYLPYFQKLKNYEKRYGIKKMLKYVGFENEFK